MTWGVSRADIEKLPPTNAVGDEFSLVLARMIRSIQNDPEQLRNAVYELARVKLQKEVWLTEPRLSILEMRRLTLALETAIERVETVSSGRDALPSPQHWHSLPGNTEI